MRILLIVALSALLLSACGVFGGAEAAADYKAAKERATRLEQARKAAPPLHVDLHPHTDPYKVKARYE
jgi:hypothetical protein